MSNVFVTSDWHLGHKNISKNFRPLFNSDKHHNATLIKNYKATIGKNDVVYFLGDIVFDHIFLPIIKDLPGRKYIVLGNHDTEFLSIRDILYAFDDAFGLVQYKRAWLSHAPIHQQELRGRINIHGHCHGHKIKFNYNEDDRYINICPEHTNYFPINIAGLLK